MISKPSNDNWRFLNTGYNSGYYNMALDEALAQTAELSQQYATLRVFAWNPPAVSLGFHQKYEDIDFISCERDGIDIVRRPTGGRAILHDDELTYSVVIPSQHVNYRDDISSAYELISRALVAGLQAVGIDALFERARSGNENYARGEFSVPCFSTSVRHEIIWQNRKLVGSAQRRYDGALLQHGSIMIGDSHLNLINYLANITEHQRQRHRFFLEKHTVTVNEIAGRRVTFDEMVKGLKIGFEDVLNVTLVEQEVTEEEEKRTEQLLTNYQER